MSEISSLNIKGLETKINNLSNSINSMDQNVSRALAGIENVKSELAELRNQFDKMVDDQRKSANLQRAMTELVRVRQEIKQNFGNYQVIRDTMIGTLQATEIALVKRNTISRVSEELMLSTPKYWLAPCMVALAAWIGNDRDLANRAIAEAVKRDEERTSLTMALICRRSNRLEVCHEWLARYFSTQNAAHFSEGSLVYIDAYLNGVFGIDEKHLCDDYVSRWLIEIKGINANFEANQSRVWAKYCEGFSCPKITQNDSFKRHVSEYEHIKAYTDRIDTAEAVIEDFRKTLAAEVNQGVLRERIDQNLISLISRHNDDEQPLRREEAYLLAVKRHGGDEEAAKREITAKELRRKKQDQNVVEEMVRVITDKDENVMLSERKTAISFLGGYINQGVADYVAKGKKQFPNVITLKANGWMENTESGENLDEMLESYSSYIKEHHSKEIAEVETQSSTKYKVLFIVMAIIGVVMLALGASDTVKDGTIIGIAAAAASAYFAYRTTAFRRIKEKQIIAINQKYDELIESGLFAIESSVKQWITIKERVEKFEKTPIRVA